MRYVCSVCGFVYDEAGNAPWAELPAGWKCPLCGASKAEFAPEGASSSPAAASPVSHEDAEIRPLSALETAALCSNLAKGCEKQCLHDQASAFRKLAEWYASREKGEPSASFSRLLDLISSDLDRGYPRAWETARRNADRGALRALTWSEKVTRILKSLLTRYAAEGDAMTANTGVYVCTVCGFVYVGDEPPQVCPVCKAPNRKFEKIGG